VKSIRATCALIALNSLPRVAGRTLVGRLHVSEIEESPEDGATPLSKYVEACLLTNENRCKSPECAFQHGLFVSLNTCTQKIKVKVTVKI